MSEPAETITLDDSSQQSPGHDSSSIIEIDLDKDEKEDDQSVVEIVNIDSTEIAFVAPKPSKGDTTLPRTKAENNLIEEGELEDEEKPVFQIIFRDEMVMRNYKRKMELFVRELLRTRCKRKDLTFKNKDLVLQVFDNGVCSSDATDLIDNAEAQEDIGISRLFEIDKNPEPVEHVGAPIYETQKFHKVLKTRSENEADTKDTCIPKMHCFNCMGNHSLRDCEEPRNAAAINKNRREHNAKRGNLGVRYHVDEEQKYGHFVPGQISNNLRAALSLGDNELPIHIYNMRQLGYPPGWLEEAKLQHSGLTLIGSEGQVDPGSDDEGEIMTPGDKDRFDSEKFIDFPGFNVKPPSGTRDNHKEYWRSELADRSSKATMLASFKHKAVEAGYKRKKLTNLPSKKVKLDTNPGEMDLDEVEDLPVECLPVTGLFIPPLPKDDMLPPPPPPPLEKECDNSLQADTSTSSFDDSIQEESRKSPSLDDLESAKKKLLEALNDSNSQSDLDNSKKEVSYVENSLLEETSSLNGSTATDVNTSQNEISIKENEPAENTAESTNLTPKNNSTKSPALNKTKIIPGTPILKSCSPFKYLPSAEKFSKDICDVINFENLPDSTGKYDQMVGVLEKVRATLTKLHDE